MNELAGVWLTGFGVALVSVFLLFGFVCGFVLRWLTDFRDHRILVVSGTLSILLFAIFVFVSSFGHGALSVVDYANWRALVEFVVMFCVNFFGAGLGVRANQSLSRFLLGNRSEEGE